MWNEFSLMKRGNLIVLSAPSGTGKTTVCRKLAERVENMSLSVSHTTRPMKNREKDGFDYYFVDEKTFDRMVKDGEFLEWAKIYGRRYGTSKRVVWETLNSGRDLLLEIDVQGGMNVKKLMPDSILIALFPPDRNALYKRLKKRKREIDSEIEERMTEALRELEILMGYDFFVINRELEKAIKDVMLIIEGHNYRVDRNREFLQNLISQFRR